MYIYCDVMYERSVTLRQREQVLKQNVLLLEMTNLLIFF